MTGMSTNQKTGVGSDLGGMRGGGQRPKWHTGLLGCRRFPLLIWHGVLEEVAFSWWAFLKEVAFSWWDFKPFHENGYGSWNKSLGNSPTGGCSELNGLARALKSMSCHAFFVTSGHGSVC